MQAAQATMRRAHTVLGLECIVAVTALDPEGSINGLRKVDLIFERWAKISSDDKRVFVSHPWCGLQTRSPILPKFLSVSCSRAARASSSALD